MYTLNWKLSLHFLLAITKCYSLFFLFLFSCRSPVVLAHIDRHSAFFQKAIIRDSKVLVTFKELASCKKGLVTRHAMIDYT